MTRTKNGEMAHIPVPRSLVDRVHKFKQPTPTGREMTTNEAWGIVASEALRVANGGARLVDTPHDKTTSTYVMTSDLDTMIRASELTLGRPVSSKEEALTVAVRLAELGKVI